MSGVGPNLMPMASVLEELDAYEATVRPTLLTRLIGRVAQTRLFGIIYARIGPPLDRWLMRRRSGQQVSRQTGLPTLLLTTTGRKSGEPRSSPLLYARDGATLAVLGTNFGTGNHPAWTENLLAQPAAQVQVGPVTFAVRGEMAAPADYEAWYPRFVAFNPAYATYRIRWGDRLPRMFLLHIKTEA